MTPYRLLLFDEPVKLWGLILLELGCTNGRHLGFPFHTKHVHLDRHGGDGWPCGGMCSVECV